MPGLQANTAGMNVNGRDTVANAEYFQQELASLRNNIESLMNIWRGLSANEFNKSSIYLNDFSFVMLVTIFKSPYYF